MRICEQGCENLAIAIIRQAVNDYSKALKTLKKNPKNIEENRVKNECEDFFNSDFFEYLTYNLDSKYIISNIERMIENEKKAV